MTTRTMPETTEARLRELAELKTMVSVTHQVDRAMIEVFDPRFVWLRQEPEYLGELYGVDKVCRFCNGYWHGNEWCLDTSLGAQVRAAAACGYSTAINFYDFTPVGLYAVDLTESWRDGEWHQGPKHISRGEGPTPEDAASAALWLAVMG